MENASGGGVVQASINVTPLVDVCLVLLIIFLVVNPVTQLGYDALLPAKPEKTLPVPPPGTLLVRLMAGGEIRLNSERVEDTELSARLSARLAGRVDRTVFFEAANATGYGRAAEVLDALHAAGARIGIATEPRDILPGP